LAEISPNLPEKIPKKMENDLQKTTFSSHSTSSTIFAQISLTCPKKLNQDRISKLKKNVWTFILGAIFAKSKHIGLQ